MLNKKNFIFPQRFCETLSGDIAYTVGRLAFRTKRPMLIEHVGGLYLEHDLSGKVLTQGYGPEYNIAYVWAEETPASYQNENCRKDPGKLLVSSLYECG